MVNKSDNYIDKRKLESDSEDEASLKNEKELKINENKLIYLDTVNRYRLDFDFEKLCSITLSNFNVYACLICGKFFQGKGTSTHAYYHSIQDDHHVFINLTNLKVYILPDDYEVKDTSLDDIKFVIQPKFTKSMVDRMLYSKPLKYSYDINHKKYLPGYIGLNNIKRNGYINVILQSLIHVPPIRDYFLLMNLNNHSSQLVQRFSLLTRKMYNPSAFKGQVSPHELLQEISKRSNKQFKITEQVEPILFLSWFLNQLHKDLGGNKNKQTIISQTFQGQVKCDTLALENVFNKMNKGDRVVTSNKFMYLTMDLPPPPLFQDQEDDIIPQVPISNVLSKFDGKTKQETSSTIKLYSIDKMPPYLIFYYKRFNKNNFALEKNPTIVTFNVNNLQLDNWITGDVLNTTYDLITNIGHDGDIDPSKGNYFVHVNHSATDQWFKITDLTIEPELHQIISLSEAYLQIWQRKDLVKPVIDQV